MAISFGSLILIAVPPVFVALPMTQGQWRVAVVAFGVVVVIDAITLSRNVSNLIPTVMLQVVCTVAWFVLTMPFKEYIQEMFRNWGFP